MISVQLAQSIVKELTDLTSHSINFMDKRGVIIASHDHERIGQRHEGARQVIQQRKTVEISADDATTTVRQGMNLPIVVHSELIGVIGITGPLERVRTYGSIIQRMTEILAKEAVLNNSSLHKHYARDIFVRKWMSGEYLNEEDIRSEALQHSIELTSPFSCGVFNITNFVQGVFPTQPPSLQPALQTPAYLDQVADWLPHGASLLTSQGVAGFVLFFHQTKGKEWIVDTAQRLSEWMMSTFGFSVEAGISPEVQQLTSLKKGIVKATQASALSSLTRQSIVVYEALGTELLILELSHEQKRDFAARILHLHHPEMNDLLKDLYLFFRNDQSVQRTAEQLFIHKNTLQYRLKKIASITKRDPRQFQDAQLLFTALLCLRLSDISLENNIHL
ncbi:hypothetical protein G4V62_16575 [Bacillaceae bacterium SIJ1]|uniref:CdaR family transcriptional regulator n=1 Tax=Litoribacterium kuwaitense TaxID=1398745 RepID=UPI0013EC773B|nr:sugar diacid recognition domain-containing protein [Litoribacterium kuwaitense]NGP46484.1 hypothetical protein [Litoribacterium kuwaitense]